MLQIKAFGGLAVHRGEERVLGAAAQPRRLAVLAMIARAGTRGITRERLQTTLWPDADADRSAHALKQALYALKRDADVDELFLGTRELRLNPDDVRCDVSEFEALVRRREFERAIELHDGPFLDGFRLSAVPEFEDWVEEERRALDQQLAHALEELAAACLDAQDAVSAVRWNRRLAALDPLNGRVTVSLMHALLSAGDRAGALQQARIYEDLVAQALDLPPDAAVMELARAIRSGEVQPTLVSDAITAIAAPTRTPPSNDALDARLMAESGGGIPPVRHASPPTDLSIAVLPLATIGTTADASAFGDGLTDELLSALGRMPDVRVVGRHGSQFLDLTDTDLATFGTRLGVASVLEGRVRWSGSEARVTVRLFRTRDGTLIWTDRYDRPVDDLLGVQEQIARSIAEDVSRGLRVSAGLPLAPSPRERADALYAQGMQAWTPQGAGLGQGLEQFREAIAIDPGHARAHAALAESYTQLAFYGFLPATRAAALVDAASREAMRLAPDSAESHLARGTSLLWVDREFDAGTRELERALELDPLSVVARARLAFVRLCHDGPDEIDRATAQRAATVSGATGLSRVMYGQQLLAAHRFDEAISALHAAIDTDAPSFLAYHWLCAAYVQKGMGAEAVAAAVAEASLSDRHPWALMSLVVSCALAGQTRRAESLLETLHTRAAAGCVQSSVLGVAHAALGDVETGMGLLERAVQEHDPSMMMLRTFPIFTPFHHHPRFRALLREAGWRDWDTTEFRIPIA